MLGNGGVFCWYSYISPLLTHLSGFAADKISGLMVLAGIGMVVGNLVSGRLSDRFSPGRVAASVQSLTFLLLILIFFFAHIPLLSVVLMCFCTASLFALSSPQQVLLLRFSKGGELLGAAQCPGGIQSGKCDRCFCRRITVGSRDELPLYGFGGSSFCFGWVYPFSDILPEVRETGTGSHTGGIIPLFFYQSHRPDRGQGLAFAFRFPGFLMFSFSLDSLVFHLY